MTVPVTRIATATEQTDDRQTMVIQAAADRVRQVLNNRGAPPNTSGAITFTAGLVQRIEHKLQRQPVEWSVVDVTIGYSSFRRTAWDAISISIQSENACTAVFRFS